MGTIMSGRFFIATIGVFAGLFAGTYTVNVMIIDYGPIMHLFRTRGDELGWYWVLILADLILAGAFVWIYARGIESKPWLGQGLRFGFAAALLSFVPISMRYFVAQPVPQVMLIQQVVLFTVLMMLFGAFVAFVYRGATRPA